MNQAVHPELQPPRLFFMCDFQSLIVPTVSTRWIHVFFYLASTFWKQTKFLLENFWGARKKHHTFSKTKFVSGTFFWVTSFPPWKHRGQKYNHMVDMWAFGVLLYLLMYGHYPCPGLEVGSRWVGVEFGRWGCSCRRRKKYNWLMWFLRGELTRKWGRYPPPGHLLAERNPAKKGSQWSLFRVGSL